MATGIEIFIYVILSLFSLIILGVSGFFVYIVIQSKKFELPPNAPIVENQNVSLSGGYCMGLEVSCERVLYRSKERYRVKFIPLGREFNNLKNEYVEDLKIYEFIVEKGFRIEKIRAEMHKSRNMIVYLARDKNSLPLIYKESEFGKWIEKKISVETITNMFIEDANLFKKQVAEYMLKNTKLPEELITGQITDLLNKIFKLKESEKPDKSIYYAPGMTR